MRVTAGRISALSILAVVGLACLLLFKSFVVDAGSSGGEAPATAADAGPSYPIIYDGESVTAPVDVQNWAYFEPLFGKDRANVNPAEPKLVNGRDLVFEKPGEYYLLLNGTQPLRIVVLARDEPVSESVVRVFDFLTANLLVTRGQDKLFGDDPDGYTRQLFLSKDPGLLLCGPTLALFQRLIDDRFRLPARDVTFTGTYMEGGKVMYSTHNMLEVYLPDVKKWVQFDINNGFMVKWQGAIEISDAVRTAAGSGRALDADEWSAIDWTPYEGVTPLRSISAANSETKFRPELVGTASVREFWPLLSHALVGGPSYWAGPRFGMPGLPRDFDLYYATEHDDPLLIDASKRWAGNWDLTVKVVTREEMEELLETAYAGQIAEKAWLKRIHPQQRDRLEPQG